MSYFQDLSEYTYSRFAIRPGTLNVGWLDPKEPFRTGAAVPQFVDLLWEFCCRKVVVTRGFCGCYLCTPQILDVVYATRGEKTLKLGSAEIRVFSSEGKIFAAPDLIYHYVTCHAYLPPDEFISAVLTGPRATSAEYKALLDAQTLPAA